ncbi:MAG TPA: shikimate kinase, partial [Gammaproteobacteria bacterium]|nr:shikimate kinase [Gammaproteobacteria bacterium]
MGAGKTAIGRELARLLEREFMDTDQEIERRTGADIPLIFETEGEAGFRRRERQVIEELTQRQKIVLATGGGAVPDSANRACLQSRGVVRSLQA